MRTDTVAHRKRGKEKSTKFSLDGFYRINVVDADGRIEGDSGWHHNTITNVGIETGLAYWLATSASASSLKHMHLGSSQSSVATNATSLPGAYGMSLAQAIGTTQYTSRGASNAGATVRYMANFVSNSIISTTNQTIACIGLFFTTGAGSSIFCGGSFASSTLGNSQAINCTYDLVLTAT